MEESIASVPTVGEMPRPELHRRSFLREIIDTVVLIGAIYALVNLASVRFIVEGPSMEPNFHSDQFIIVSRINYLLGEPERGDIVVFHPPNQDADEPPYIKRVIGLPGETIQIREGHVFINDVELNEPYINETTCNTHCTEESLELLPDTFFVMGDNRNHSSDSRAFGIVTRDRIIGEAVIRYWPISDWGVVSRIHFPDDAQVFNPGT
jgi:signal peptidase I